MTQRHPVAETHRMTYSLGLWSQIKYYLQGLSVLIPQISTNEYEVATISRLLKIIGLFCKRVL